MAEKPRVFIRGSHLHVITVMPAAFAPKEAALALLVSFNGRGTQIRTSMEATIPLQRRRQRLESKMGLLRHTEGLLYKRDAIIGRPKALRNSVTLSIVL
jgi:hypothetical protein